MSNKRKRQQRISLVLGIVLAGAMGFSLLLPLFSTAFQQPVPPPNATDITQPTQPAPIENLEAISFDTIYLHNSGLFTVAEPGGWTVSREINNTGEAQVTFNNPNQLSVIEARLLRPTADTPVSEVEDLNNIFNDSWLASSWNSYSSWEEDVRSVQDDRLVIDFTLGRSGQEYIARQVAFADDTWVYVLRVVTPSNASEQLQYVLNNTLPTFQPIERYIGDRIEWDAYRDEVNQFIIRYPGDWVVADSAPGAPASISGSQAQLRVETVEAAIDSEEAASDYVGGLRSGTEVISVAEVDQFGTVGYQVAYERPTLDGEPESGAVLLLPDGDTTHVANLLLPAGETVDFNSADIPEAYSDLVGVLGSFSLSDDLGLASSN